MPSNHDLPSRKAYCDEHTIHRASLHSEDANVFAGATRFPFETLKLFSDAQDITDELLKRPGGPK